jgi:hypothetical protein
MATKELCDLLEAAIRNGTSSNIVKPAHLGKGDVLRPVCARLATFDSVLQRSDKESTIIHPEIVNACNERLLFIKDGKSYLPAVDPAAIHADIKKYGFLEHDGLVVNGGNNINNLNTHGVFGNPNVRAPTYLCRPSHSLAFYVGDEQSAIDFEVSLVVRLDELMRRRSLFVDPETFSMPVSWEGIGDSFFVLGGIPREAIASFNASNGSEYTVSFKNENRGDSVGGGK